jgi:hypothetical protein
MAFKGSEASTLATTSLSACVDEANDLLAPAIRPGVIDSANGACAVACQSTRREELDVDEGQVLAERKTPRQPIVAVAQRHALARRDELQCPDVLRPGRLAQVPEIQVIEPHLSRQHLL